MSTLKSPRLTVILLLSVFILPMLLAGYVYRYDQSTHPKTVNRGILLQPPFLSATHLSLPIHWPQRQWWLVYVSTKPCTAMCQNNLYKMRQIWIALNKDQARVQRVWLALEDSHRSISEPGFKQRYGNMLRVALTQQDWTKFWQSTAAQETKFSFIYQGNSFFIVDPMGNLVLVYPGDTGPRDIYKDLTHLLKVSGIG